MLLRGDPPKDKPKVLKNPDGFDYASDLINFVKKHYDYFAIGAAAYPEKHPEARTLDEDVRNLKHKVDSGVDFLITQMFFNNEYYFRFLEKLNPFLP
jgi:methylenetetrahydrofolate reductase (NADPH)